MAPTDLKNFVVEYLAGSEGEDVINYMLRNKLFYQIDYLNALKEVKPKILRDTKYSAFFAYRNGIVEVTGGEIKDPVPYEDCSFCIWEEHIIKRDFRKDVSNSKVFSFYELFLWQLANQDSMRYDSICSIIGYALHSYRTSANTKAIIFSDEIVSDLPEGGSGKSLLVTALSYFRSMVIKDGKSFNPKSSFAWSDVDKTTDIVLIDDVNKNFAFEDLFSVITQGICVERKNKDQYYLPIEDSPLIIITTNNILRGSGASFNRRQINVDIHQYFSHRHTPVDQYRHTFFTDWNEEEWARFDYFMLKCVQINLEYGIIQAPESDRMYKEAIRATNLNFVDWFLSVYNDFVIFTSTTEALERYKSDTAQNNIRLSARIFLNYIKSCCNIFGWEFIQEKNSQQRGFRLKFN